MKEKRFHGFWLMIAKITGLLPAWLFFASKVYYADGAPRGGRLPRPCLLMSNHTSLMDFPLYLLIFWRYTLRFLMAEVLYRNRLLATLLNWLGGIRVEREAFDLGFVSKSLDVLDRRGIVGVFPQGRLPVKGQKWPYKPGIVWIAMHTDAPIVPVYTAGGYGLFRRARVIVGAPFTLPGQGSGRTPDAAETAALTALLEEKEEALRAELERRVKR